MRTLRLLVDQQALDAGEIVIVPAGTEITVSDAEARTLMGAIGLVEDLGPAKPAKPAK